VFVFAVSQLSHHLLEHLSWRGVAETLVLLPPIFAVWAYTSWAAITVPEEHSRTLWMVLAVMLLGFFMNASVTRAFTTSGWAFVVPLLLIQFGRTVWTIMNTPAGVLREHTVRTLLWLIATTPFWVVGAAVNPDERLGWWALAACLDIVGAWVAHPVPSRRLHSEHVAFPGTHMLERCRLFLLIALGETVLMIGVAVAAVPLTPMTVVTGTIALTGTVALWALSFGRAARLALRYVEETSNPIYATRLAGNVLTVMVAGLIALAVANEDVIAHPYDPLSIVLQSLLFGGPILFVLAQAWYAWVVLRLRPHRYLLGCIVLVVLAVVTRPAAPVVTLSLVAATLAILAILDQH
jgi:low temperature requirement protein LtrA